MIDLKQKEKLFSRTNFIDFNFHFSEPDSVDVSQSGPRPNKYFENVQCKYV